jgi:Patatin-like phospholipase
LGDRFDLLVGTSTGGIIALGLSVGKTASEISSFYAHLVPKIFSSKAQRASILQYFEPKYPSDILKNALDAQFGDSTLENVRTDVCITGVSLGLGKPRLHKSLYQTRYLDRGLLSDDFLQRLGFLSQIPDLAAGRCSCCIPGQPPLAGFQELLRPVVIQALGNALATAQLRDAVLTRSILEPRAISLFGFVPRAEEDGWNGA